MNKNKPQTKKRGWQEALDEEKLYQHWMKASDGFAAPNETQKNAFAMSLPPPNITGRLHMGHALNATLQDIVARWRRMKGDAVLWQPATDHAGIATQAVVERELAKEGNQSRQSLGREAFVGKCWEWREQRGGEILQQLRRLGASLDWQRECFTLDENLSHAVREAFCRLFNEGLIYRDKRLINWDPVLQTAISDLEVQAQEQNGFLWHIRYPLADDEGNGLVVATTRPETLFGDAAVAVHPKDERYKNLIGREVVLPLAGRTIPIIADDHADPDAGSGAVKITPAHDFDDYEVGKRHDLPLLDVLDEHACLNQQVPQRWQGLERFEARKQVLAELKEQGLLVKEEAHRLTLPLGDRSGAVIEPRLMEQWFLHVETMAQNAMQAVKTGETKIYPKTWEKTFFQWLENIRPWCLSRQVWWGHRIPVWYGADGHAFAAKDEAEAKAQAKQHYGKEVELKQDEDVLDTWFSSGLWTFSPLGWPQQTKALETYYPNQLMITGFDILFFWVARMMMLGLHFTDEVPFRHVYLHALVRDEKGQKMTKSRGNVIDPLELVETYGADALRFSFAAMARQGRDIKLSRPRIEGYRNFITKLWNACQFAKKNQVEQTTKPPETISHIYNRWILSELHQCIGDMNSALDSYRFDDAAGALYNFIWHRLCDWYLEFIKPILNDESHDAQAETRAMLGYVLAQSLRLTHPFMPFISEHLWQGESLLMQQAWPQCEGQGASDKDKKEMERVIGIVEAVRSARDLFDAPASKKFNAYVPNTSEIRPNARDILLQSKSSATAVIGNTFFGKESGVGKSLERHREIFARRARIECHIGEKPPDGLKTYLVRAGGFHIYLDVSDIDIETIMKKIERDYAKANDKFKEVEAWFEKHDIKKVPPEACEKKQKEKSAAEDALYYLTMKKNMLDAGKDHRDWT